MCAHTGARRTCAEQSVRKCETLMDRPGLLEEFKQTNDVIMREQPQLGYYYHISGRHLTILAFHSYGLTRKGSEGRHCSQLFSHV